MSNILPHVNPYQDVCVLSIIKGSAWFLVSEDAHHTRLPVSAPITEGHDYITITALYQYPQAGVKISYPS